MTRHLIVNADDFGWTGAVNAGVVAAHDHGIVTSTSLMVRGSAVDAAVALASSRPRLSVGLHVDLGEWIHTSTAGWVERYTVVDNDDATAVEAEVARQLDTFGRLVGRSPTHLDGHQHIQRDEPASGVLRAVAARLGIPLRLADDRIRHRGDFYGQGPRAEPHHECISPANLVAIVGSLSPGWTELGCHPGIGVDPASSVYAAEREIELAALCGDEVRTAMAAGDVVLASFAELP